MITIIPSRALTLTTSATRYSVLSGVSGINSSEAPRQQVIPTAGTLGNCAFKLTTAPGSGKSWLVGLRVNGATVLSTTISDTAVDGSISGTVNVSAGDLVNWIITPSGTPAAASLAAFCQFEGTDSTESIIIGCGQGTFSTTANRFSPINGFGGSLATTDGFGRQIMPTAGTLKKLYVRLDIDPGTNPDAYSFTLHKNAADQTLTTTITADSTTGNDTTNSVSIAAGDTVSIKVAPLNTPSATPYMKWGMVFVPTVLGETAIPGDMAGNNLDVSVTEYIALNNVTVASTTTEANWQVLVPPCDIKKLYVLLSGSPGSGGDAYTFTVRDDGADTAVVVSITNAATSGNDVTNTHSVTDISLVNLKLTPSVSPTALQAYWGIVLIAPIPPSTFTPSPMMHMMAQSGGLL